MRSRNNEVGPFTGSGENGPTSAHKSTGTPEGGEVDIAKLDSWVGMQMAEAGGL